MTMNPTTRCFLTLLLALTPLHFAEAQLPAGTVRPTPAELAARIDSIVRTDVLPRGFPSVSIAVTRGGKTLLDQAWGAADATTGTRADASTVYRLGALSKQFTSALVLKLVDRGKLALTDSIGRYLTGLDPTWNGVTIEHVLNHTSGLPREFASPARLLEPMSAETRVALAVERGPLVATPGAQLAYSNLGYMLLGVLVEKAYGKPYGSVIRDELAKPLGLGSLSECDDLPKGRQAAVGYHRFSDGLRGPVNVQHISQLRGSGSLCATAGDVAKWNDALHHGRVLSPASYVAMTTPRGAATSRYGFGLHARKSTWGSPALMHDGAQNGFHALNAWYADDSLSVTFLANALPGFTEVVAVDFIGLIALGGTPKAVPPMRTLVLPAGATQGEGRPAIVGAYERGVGDLSVFVTYEDGKLEIIQPSGTKAPMFLKSGTTYAVGGPQGDLIITFRVDASGAVTGLGVKEGRFERELRKVK